MNDDAPSAALLRGAELSAALRAGIHRLISREEIINKIDVFPVSDGDTGTNLALTLQAVLAALRGAVEPHAGQLLARVADAALDGARGNSGAILAQFLLGVADTARPHAALTPSALADAFQTGAACARESLAEPRGGTILSVIADYARAFATAATQGERDLAALFSAGRSAGLARSDARSARGAAPCSRRWRGRARLRRAPRRHRRVSGDRRRARGE